MLVLLERINHIFVLGSLIIKCIDRGKVLNILRRIFWFFFSVLIFDTLKENMIVLLIVGTVAKLGVNNFLFCVTEPLL